MLTKACLECSRIELKSRLPQTSTVLNSRGKRKSSSVTGQPLPLFHRAQCQESKSALEVIKGNGSVERGFCSASRSKRQLSRTGAMRDRFRESNEEEKSDHDESLSSKPESSHKVEPALKALKWYKQQVSPLLPKSCRFLPTCSEYSMEAYKKYGNAKGFILTAWRLFRCNPLNFKINYQGKYDPPVWPPVGLESLFSK